MEYKKKVKESIASQTSTYELDWKFHYEKGVDEFYNTYTECGWVAAPY